MNQNKLKIALGDLRHRTIGRHSVLMPIGIGYIASYLLAHIDSKEVEVRLYDNPDIILKDIDQWKPTVIGLSNYCWNAELSRLVFSYAKKTNPNAICVAGGPEIPIEQSECKEYLSYRQEIDFYIYHEGEVAFTRLIQKLLDGVDPFYLQTIPEDGVMSIHPKTEHLVRSKPVPPLMNLDEIPSPYLTGLMDQWFNGYYAPAIETTRGCPFTCGYCFAGQSNFNAVARFSIEHLKNELVYIAKKMRSYPNTLLLLCDTNFGMYKVDEEVALYIRDLQDEFGWPNAFNVTTGKINYDRILRIASHLKNRMFVTCSVQSLNPKTLEVINRKNLPMDEYKKIHDELKERGMPSFSELIVPMPEETKSSFFGGIKILMNAGVETITPYTTMLLKGTHFASRECRKKYKMQTKFRLLPRQFGEYFNEKCFEIEEVCVATNTLSFQDYLACRGFALITSFLSTEQFDIIRLHLKELGINRYDYLHYLWDLIRSGKTELSEIYNKYLEETKEELWDSKEALCESYMKAETYAKLMAGELGDNLIRKYKTIFFIECCISSINLAYDAIENLVGDVILDQEVRDSLEASRQWMIACRNIKKVFTNDASIYKSQTLHLSYDVHSWYLSHTDSDTLISFKKPISYKTFYDEDLIKNILNEGKRLYGEDLTFLVGKLFVNWSIKDFWCKCTLWPD